MSAQAEEPKQEQPSYQNFLSALLEFLAARPNANVLVVVESATGFETYRSVVSPIWCLGAAHAATEQFEEMLRMLFHSDSRGKETIEQEEHARMMESMKRDKEKAN